MFFKYLFRIMRNQVEFVSDWVLLYHSYYLRKLYIGAIFFMEGNTGSTNCG